MRLKKITLIIYYIMLWAAGNTLAALGIGALHLGVPISVLLGFTWGMFTANLMMNKIIFLPED